jgi:hypothetical protein
VTVTPVYDGTSDASQSPEVYTTGSNKFTLWSYLMTNAQTAHVVLAGTGVIEIDALDWSIEALPAFVQSQFA